MHLKIDFPHTNSALFNELNINNGTTHLKLMTHKLKYPPPTSPRQTEFRMLYTIAYLNLHTCVIISYEILLN